MTEKGGFRPDRSSEVDVPRLREGYNAIVMPRLGRRDSAGAHVPGTVGEGLDTLNMFLQSLDEQDARIVSTFSSKFAVEGDQPGIETRQVAIVRKERPPIDRVARSRLSVEKP